MTDFKSMVVHRIRVAQADVRMSQEELDKAAGVSAESIKNENGESCPLFQTVVPPIRAREEYPSAAGSTRH